MSNHPNPMPTTYAVWLHPITNELHLQWSCTDPMVNPAQALRLYGPLDLTEAEIEDHRVDYPVCKRCFPS